VARHLEMLSLMANNMTPAEGDTPLPFNCEETAAEVEGPLPTNDMELAAEKELASIKKEMVEVCAAMRRKWMESMLP